MGSGGWFKTIIGRRKTKHSKDSLSERSNASKKRNHSHKVSSALCNGSPDELGLSLEDRAATYIQTAYRGYRARKTLRRLKGLQRLQVIRQGHSVKKQISTTLSYLQSWHRIQAEIRARRVSMVTEGRIKQKKHDNQLKLEAKLHEIEIDWHGGSDTMEEILSRVRQREEAAVKRERAMAYAFSHQWQANSGLGPLSYEIGKGNWGWSWVERWIAARPWEKRLPLRPKASIKTDEKLIINTSGSLTPVKPAGITGKVLVKKISLKAIDERDAKPIVASSQTKTKMKKERDLPLQTNGIAA